MKINRLVIILFIATLLLVKLQTVNAEDTAPIQEISLSTDLADLLRAEMIEIAGGVQRISLSIAIADWKTIMDTSIKIRDSYIMDKNLTEKQKQELEKTLPEQFKLLDAELHRRADKIITAANAHDAELVNFHFSRLIENCTRCHSTYARARFPGFSEVVIEHSHN